MHPCYLLFHRRYSSGCRRRHARPGVSPSDGPAPDRTVMTPFPLDGVLLPGPLLSPREPLLGPREPLLALDVPLPPPLLALLLVPVADRLGLSTATRPNPRGY